MHASVVIAAYNKPDVLRLVLNGYARQSCRDFEVIVADDGSSEDIASVIDELRPQLGVPIRHLWHEDRGWRKNTMLNNAIRAAESPYLVFTDGDCLPHSRFVQDHLALREMDRFLCGRRAEMSARWTASLSEDGVRTGRYEKLGLRDWWEGLTGAAVRIEDGLRFESPRIRNILHRTSRGMLGSNFSLHREALESINGFDEEYDGPGCGEDSDVQFRLELLGLTAKSLRHLAIQFHLHHPRTVVPQRCLDRFARLQRERNLRCVHGLQSLSHEQSYKVKN